jgi:hypothetical protein
VVKLGLDVYLQQVTRAHIGHSYNKRYAASTCDYSNFSSSFFVIFYCCWYVLSLQELVERGTYAIISDIEHHAGDVVCARRESGKKIVIQLVVI